MKIVRTILSLILACGCTAAAHATPSAYANPGTQIPASYSFTALAYADVFAYLAGSDTASANYIKLLVNGVSTGISGLDNRSSNYGDYVDLGSVKPGDDIAFELVTTDASGTYSFYSEKADNADGLQHIYASIYGGDNIVPSGIAINFDDSNHDFDYNDESFVFLLAPAVNAVPEPASLALLGIGLAGLGLRRKVARSK